MIQLSRVHDLVRIAALLVGLCSGRVMAEKTDSLAITDPSAIIFLESHGFALHSILGVKGANNASLRKQRCPCTQGSAALGH